MGWLIWGKYEATEGAKHEGMEYISGFEGCQAWVYVGAGLRVPSTVPGLSECGLPAPTTCTSWRGGSKIP